MVAYTVDWLAQEGRAYAIGILSAHRTMKSAANALATAIENLEASWTRTDPGLKPGQMRDNPPRTEEDLFRYRAVLQQEQDGDPEARRMELRIKKLNIAN